MMSFFKRLFLYTPFMLIVGIALGVALVALAAYRAYVGGQASEAYSIYTAAGACFALAAFLERIRYVQAKRPPIMPQQLARMVKRGYRLPVPDTAPAPRQVTLQDLQEVEGYARRMALLPWGQRASVPAEDAHALFDHTVAEVRRVRGNWEAFQESATTFLSLPDPWSRIGGAEITYRLSYLQWRAYAPQGLRFALGQINTVLQEYPLQPDALVMRVKLLAGSPARQWLLLAQESLNLLKYCAPKHPRIPDAEASLRIQQGDNVAALECLDRAIAVAPSEEERFVAYATKAAVLADLGQGDAKRLEQAAQAYDQVLAIDPRDPWTWHNKSVVLQQLGRYQEALECNTRALEIMDFGVAQDMRKAILRHLDEANAQQRQA
jgi:tetratricopeptide (TPR) repeat protein